MWLQTPRMCLAAVVFCCWLTGKYVVNSGLFVGWLMNALEVLEADHDDLPLPEAGDGVPDIMQVILGMREDRREGM